jgi:hypothetical protein
VTYDRRQKIIAKVIGARNEVADVLSASSRLSSTNATGLRLTVR